MEPKMEQPKQHTPEEIAQLEKSRTISDAELLEGGAEYDENKMLHATGEEIDFASYEHHQEALQEAINKARLEAHEDVVKVIHEALKGLHGDTFARGDLSSCPNRFGMSWDQVKKEMDETTSKGVNVLPSSNNFNRHTISPEALIPMLFNTTGNWMTNRFLEVLYLKYTKSLAHQLHAVEELSRLANSPEGLKSKPLREEHLCKVLTAAQGIDPEMVENVLKSHNLTATKQPRLTLKDMSMFQGGV